MRMLEMTKSFTRGPNKFEAGKKYVMAEDFEGQLRSTDGDCIGLSYPIEQIYRQYKGQDLTGKRIMCFRTGGIGDMSFLSPVFRHLKKKFPGVFIRMASGCKQPLENLPEIDELYDMPFDAKLLEDVDYHLMFQGIIESESDISKRTHAVDLFFNYFGIDSIHFPDEEKRPRMCFTKEEMDWMNGTFKGFGVKDDDYVVGVQMESSAPIRNFPKEKLKAVIDILAKEPGVRIFLVGTEAHAMMAGFYKGNYPNVHVACSYTVRQALIMVNRYNLVVAPDSFLVQAAGALDKPLIGLYGPFPSEVRMKYFRNAVGVEPSAVCSPCYKHDFRPCIRGFPSPCFTIVRVEDILQAADYLRHKFTGTHFAYMANWLKAPNLADAEKYMMSADKGLCFFAGYYKHPNVVRVDSSPFVKADITSLSVEFKRDSYPFVLFMNDFSPKSKPVYDGSKGMVRPGGYFIVHCPMANEQFYSDLKRDVGAQFTVIHSKFDPVARDFLIIGKRAF